jgi:hypothetical protein
MIFAEWQKTFGPKSMESDSRFCLVSKKRVYAYKCVAPAASLRAGSAALHGYWFMRIMALHVKD